jgi:hypothetical protein
MKNIIKLIFCLTIFNCSSTTDDHVITEKSSILGRWDLVGFEGKVLFEFTQNKRYTFYSIGGNFQTLEELILTGNKGNNWSYDGDTVKIELNSGNFSILTPVFETKSLINVNST